MEVVIPKFGDFFLWKSRTLGKQTRKNRKLGKQQEHQQEKIGKT